MYYDNIQVIKRSGQLESFDIRKINQITEWMTDSVEDVSQGELEAELAQLLHGIKKIKSVELHELIIISAIKLITAKRPNYQYVASRGALFKLRKDVLGQFEPVHITKIINDNIDRKYYDGDILNAYSFTEINELNEYIDHKRDFSFTYAGLKQVISKYLVRNRITSELYETPQYMYMLIPMTLFKGEKDTSKRLKLIKGYYDAISTFKLNIPTPIMAGCRTTTKQYSSCVLIDIDDDLDSIAHSRVAITKYISQKAGIGLNLRFRALGDSIRNGEVEHTGIVPFIQTLEKTVKETVQNGIRGGCFPPVHEVEVVKTIKINGKDYLPNDMVHVGTHYSRAIDIYNNHLKNSL
ncbi:MAG: hypothetical protein KDH96_02590 [Candidatus Riesia sp.]|nr:hypothetical protein [Candidatus Riesia sp.]